MKILIAEDDLTSRLFMKKYLSRFGKCDMVTNGIEAVDYVMNAINLGEPYDLICLDIMMPKVDGVKVLKAIRDLEAQNKVEQAQKSKIIMTTALGETQIVKTAFDYGCDAYASKPIDISKLKEVLEKLEVI